MKLNINIPLTDTQREILLDEHRFKVVCCGRQWGKSHVAGAEVPLVCLSKQNARVWVISPTYRQSGYLFDKVCQICKEHHIPIKVKKSNQEMVITFTMTGSTFQALSGDDPDKLRGQTLDYLIIDEAAMLDDEIWQKHLRPMTAVCNAPVLFLSTPKGKNWFWDIFQKGNNKTKTNAWKSFTYTSYDGIICVNDTKDYHPGRDELDLIKKETDQATWEQEYLAKFLDSGGVVFTHYTTYPMKRTPEDGHCYIAGLDLAKHVDYTVMTIYDAVTLKPVDQFRLTNLDWTSQIQRIKMYSDMYFHPRVFTDSTGLGDSIVERLVEEGIDAVGIVLTSKMKQQVVQNLAVMLSREELLAPEDKITTDELDRYQYDHTSTGQFKYNAPSGYHDDCVMSLSLVAWGISHTAKDIGFYTEPEEKKSKRDSSIPEDDFSWDLEEFDWEYEEIPE